MSHRLVALAKEQSSQDNISVLVVFLCSPIEVARRRLMETASPNPFVQNGTDTIFRGGVTNGEDDDDFGPETDVDMVDDVLLSPAIAAAKALVAGCHEVDDLERQRQQLADFDDPADMDPNRDTPTPPAHEGTSFWVSLIYHKWHFSTRTAHPPTLDTYTQLLIKVLRNHPLSTRSP